MKLVKNVTLALLLMFMGVLPCLASTKDAVNIPILVYHNFNPTTPGWMNLTPERLEEQIKWLKETGHTFIPLQEAVEYLQGQRSSLPPKPIVLTADDGWKSVYHYLYPLVKKYQIPLTLFIFPGAISSEKNYLTWDELKEMKSSGHITIQGHTYTHPNFKIAQRKMSPEKYQQFVQRELVKSKAILEEKMGDKITLLAWPFGIYNKYLEEQAQKAGYTMAFSIDYERANRSYQPMAQPRFMILQTMPMTTFKSLMKA